MNDTRAAHDRWRTMLRRHGELRSFETLPPERHQGWEHQFAVLQAPG